MVNAVILTSKFVLYIILLIALIITFLLSYKYLIEFKIKSLDIQNLKTICKMVQLDNKIKNFDNTFKILEKKLKVEQKDIRITNIGVYVKLNTFFVEEKGLFFSFYDTKINQKSNDPSFYYLDECISQYVIKG